MTTTNRLFIVIAFTASSLLWCYANTPLAHGYEPPEPVFQTSYGELPAGKPAFTVSPGTELKSAPSATASTLETLPAGVALMVVSKDNGSQNVNGLLDCWYKVKTSGGKTGFLWGGSLSKASISTPTSGMLLLNIEGTGKGKVEKAAKAILVKDGKIVSETKFRPIELAESNTFGYSIGVSKFPSTALANKPFIARFTFQYGACDYPFGDILVAVVDNKVLRVMEQQGSGNEEGGQSFSYILPGDKGGKPNSLVIETTTENFSEKRKKTTRKTFFWSGNSFQERK